MTTKIPIPHAALTGAALSLTFDARRPILRALFMKRCADGHVADSDVPDMLRSWRTETGTTTSVRETLAGIRDHAPMSVLVAVTSSAQSPLDMVEAISNPGRYAKHVAGQPTFGLTERVDPAMNSKTCQVAWTDALTAMVAAGEDVGDRIALVLGAEGIAVNKEWLDEWRAQAKHIAPATSPVAAAKGWGALPKELVPLPDPTRSVADYEADRMFRLLVHRYPSTVLSRLSSRAEIATVLSHAPYVVGAKGVLLAHGFASLGELHDAVDNIIQRSVPVPASASTDNRRYDTGTISGYRSSSGEHSYAAELAFIIALEVEEMRAAKRYKPTEYAEGEEPIIPAASAAPATVHVPTTTSSTTAIMPTTESEDMSTATKTKTAATAAAAPATATGTGPAPLTFDPTFEIPINAMLATGGLPSINDIIARISNAEAAVASADARVKAAMAKAATAAVATPLVASGAIPAGKVVMKNAATNFGVTGAAAKAFAYDVPTFEWDHAHPHVPEVDADYVFRPTALVALLHALSIGTQRPWVHGHTGSGKSTMIEQVAARLCWPMMRVNFDSEITRADLMGSMGLVKDPTTGATTTKFIEGILPQAISGPYILMLDEIDFVRPDVSYVLQRALEGRGILLTEDGGRMVHAHPMSRIVATANTVGQGDEHGMYQGARPQSLAFLDRFQPFIPVPYLDPASEKALVMKREPALDGDTAEKISKYIVEHRQAFTNGEIIQPLSPRGIAGLASQFVAYLSVYGTAEKALMRAFEDIVLGRASAQDGAVIRGLINRCVK